MAYAFTVSGALGWAGDRLMSFRVHVDDEVSGIDLVIHGETAYDLHHLATGRASFHHVLSHTQASSDVSR